MSANENSINADAAVYVTLPESEVLGSPAQESFKGSPQPEMQPSPLPVPQAFDLFVSMARAIGLREAPDPLGNNMLEKSFADLPEATQALFRVPDKDAMKRADELLQQQSRMAPKPSSDNMVTGGAAIAELMRRAFHHASSLAKNPQAQSVRQQKRGEEAVMRESQAREALVHYANNLQDNPDFKRFNADFQSGARRGQSLECDQARRNLQEAARGTPLHDQMRNMGAQMKAWEHTVLDAEDMGVITPELRANIMKDLNHVREKAGINDHNKGQGLHERLSQIIENMQAFLNRLFSKSGPAPG